MHPSTNDKTGKLLPACFCSCVQTLSWFLLHSGMFMADITSAASWTIVYNGIQLVSLCFKPSHPQRIKSGLRETFIKRYIVERTSKAGKDRKDRVRKRKSCWENLLNEIQLKGPKRQKQTQEQNKKELVYVKGINRNVPTR